MRVRVEMVGFRSRGWQFYGGKMLEEEMAEREWGEGTNGGGVGKQNEEQNKNKR